MTVSVINVLPPESIVELQSIAVGNCFRFPRGHSSGEGPCMVTLVSTKNIKYVDLTTGSVMDDEPLERVVEIDVHIRWVDAPAKLGL